MKENFINKGKAYFFITAIIILSGILLFYMSCKSKSPTESSASLPNLVASQNTNNTTTSSSTTTTSIPANTPTSTTTLITSRSLTTTTSIAACNMEFCKVTCSINNGKPQAVQDADTIFVNIEDEVKISISVKNTGIADARKADAVLGQQAGLFHFWVTDYRQNLGLIPADNTCYSWHNAFQIDVLRTAEQSEKRAFVIVLKPFNCTEIRFHFFLQVL
jgi:hypothetical protein